MAFRREARVEEEEERKCHTGLSYLLKMKKQQKPV